MERVLVARTLSKEKMVDCIISLLKHRILLNYVEQEMVILTTKGENGEFQTEICSRCFSLLTTSLELQFSSLHRIDKISFRALSMKNYV